MTKGTVQNSGVSVEASSTEFEKGNSNTSRNIKNSYYGVIDEIWELDYKDLSLLSLDANGLILGALFGRMSQASFW